jgi:hypothetical protein
MRSINTRSNDNRTLIITSYAGHKRKVHISDIYQVSPVWSGTLGWIAGLYLSGGDMFYTGFSFIAFDQKFLASKDLTFLGCVEPI